MPSECAPWEGLPGGQRRQAWRGTAQDAAACNRLRCPPPAASIRPTPGTRAVMEAVKKFSRIRVSIAAICCSPAAFMYAAWMMKG